MKSRILILGVISVVTAFVSAPVYLRASQAPPASAQHDQHHSEAAAPPAQATGDQQAGMMAMMAKMKATELKLDELVKKMNAATGPEKVDAIAELLTALVQDHRAMHESMMANMPGMTNIWEACAGAGTPPHRHRSKDGDLTQAARLDHAGRALRDERPNRGHDVFPAVHRQRQGARNRGRP